VSTDDTSSVPIAYIRLTLELAEERGVSRQTILDGIDISQATLDRPEARITLFEYGRIVARTLARTGDAGLGYEFGLRSNLTSHGLVGFGIMSHRTLREALDFIGTYLVQLRSPGFTLRCFTEGEHVVTEIREAVDYGPLRQYAVDMVMVAMTRVIQPFVPRDRMQIWFDCPEPDHYPSYREKLPPVRFDMGVNQLRCPLEYMDVPVETANVSTVQFVTRELERDLAILGHEEDILARVRAVLHESRQQNLESVARHLGVSSRTLKRKLKARGFTYRKLVDEVRREQSIRLLRETPLSVEEIAWQVGYSAHSNFIRAFRRWTGVTPATFRTQAKGSGPK